MLPQCSSECKVTALRMGLCLYRRRLVWPRRSMVISREASRGHPFCLWALEIGELVAICSSCCPCFGGSRSVVWVIVSMGFLFRCPSSLCLPCRRQSDWFSAFLGWSLSRDWFCPCRPSYSCWTFHVHSPKYNDRTALLVQALQVLPVLS